MSPPRCTCLVNNFNYHDYVVEAVASALAQTRPFDEIIVVDDGSTDRSLEVLDRHFRDEPRVRVIAKVNKGQLSCFNVGFLESTGDFLFFLDADDRYRPNYVAEALAFFEEHPDCGLLFCDYLFFGGKKRTKQRGDRSRLLGYSLIDALHTRSWIGAPTSCLVARRSFLQSLLPLPLEEDWRIRADDCLVYGADLLLARKGYLHATLVECRMHPNNNHRKRKTGAGADFVYNVAVRRLFSWVAKSRDLNPDALAELVHSEFRTHTEPTYALFRRYMKIAWRSNLWWRKRVALMASICRHYLRPDHR